MNPRWPLVSLLVCLGASPALAQPDPIAPDPIEPDPIEADPVEAEEPPQPADAQPEPTPEPEPAPAAAEPPGDRAAAAAEPEPEPEQVRLHQGGFGFGTYGRVIAATDSGGRPGRNGDITAWGSRLDHNSYAELELRREDHWASLDADSRIVASLALAHPLFHWDGGFDAAIAVRNLFIEERGLGLEGLSLWAGSRMLRGDDAYLLDFWPLDNLNTVGAGVRYDAPTRTSAQLAFGLKQPDNPFYKQEVERPVPLNQFGAATVRVLDRLHYTASAKLEQLVMLGDAGAGLKFVGYGEMHQVPKGQRETEQADVFEDLPHQSGWVVGGQIGGFTGERNTHINAFVRYSTGIAAYGEFENPAGLTVDRSAEGARELRVALSSNWEIGPFTMMLAGYVRSFRNATGDLDFGDVDEGIVIGRPHVFFTDWLGLAVEGSFQAQQRGVLRDEEGGSEPRPLLARVGRVGVIPFATLGGRGSYSRPMFYFSYLLTVRDADARALYPIDDPFRLRKLDHLIAIGAEWWFSSSSYGGAWQ